MAKVKVNLNQPSVKIAVNGAWRTFTNGSIVDYEPWMEGKSKFVLIGEEREVVTIEADPTAEQLESIVETFTTPHETEGKGTHVTELPKVTVVVEENEQIGERSLDYTLKSHGFGRWSVVDRGFEKVHEEKWLSKKAAEALCKELNGE